MRRRSRSDSSPPGYEACLDGSASPDRGASHWLLVDGDRNRAWVVIQGIGRTIVRRQRFHTRADADA